jgi:hypothetical protein
MNSSIARRIAGTEEQKRAMTLRLIATRILASKRATKVQQ